MMNRARIKVILNCTEPPRTIRRQTPHPPLRPVHQRQSHQNDGSRAQALAPGPVGGRANEWHRSGAAARALLPSLRRPYGHHRDLRGRLPSASPANHASGGNQDRYLMSLDTPRSTALSALVMDRHHCCSAQCSPALHFRWLATPKHSLSTAHSSPATRSATHNHTILAP